MPCAIIAPSLAFVRVAIQRYRPTFAKIGSDGGVYVPEAVTLKGVGAESKASVEELHVGAEPGDCRYAAQVKARPNPVVGPVIVTVSDAASVSATEGSAMEVIAGAVTLTT